MSDTSTGTDASGKAIPGAGAITATAKDAAFTVDGLSLTSKTNTVSTAISGLTFDLVAPSATGATTTVTVATNTDGLKASLQSFVDSYNTLATLVTSLTKGSISDKGVFTAAALTGDATPRALLATIRDQLAGASSSAGLSALSQLGIKTQQSNGTLSLDTVTFTAALNDKKLGSQIQTMFTGPGVKKCRRHGGRWPGCADDQGTFALYGVWWRSGQQDDQPDQNSDPNCQRSGRT